MDFARKVREIDSLVEAHTTFRERCLNLIASETRPSPLVERLIVNDLDHRYGSYTGIDPRNRGVPGECVPDADRGAGPGPCETALRSGVRGPATPVRKYRRSDRYVRACPSGRNRA